MTLPASSTFIQFGDELAPGFDLVISGKDASNATPLFEAIRPLIASIEIEEDEDMATQMTMTVVNQPDASIGQPINWRAVVDSKAFAEGNFVDVFMGYGGNRKFMDRVEIIKWLPPFPSDGPPQFIVKGYDGRHKMAHGNNPIKVKKKRKCFYSNMNDAQIVKKIADKYGFDIDVDIPTARSKAVQEFMEGKVVTHYVFPTRVQTVNMTDWAFLQKLAAINNFDLWVGFDRTKSKYVVNFKERPIAGNAEFEFDYNHGEGSLLTCTPDFSMKDQSTQVEVLLYDRKKRQIVRTIIFDTTKGEDVSLAGPSVGPGRLQATQELGSGASVRFTAFGQTIEAFSDKPFANSNQAQQFAQGWLRERDRDFLVVHGSVVGVTSLRARQIHGLVGMGKRLDGFYRFTNVKHKMAPGEIYTVEFTAHKILSQAVSRSSTTQKART